MAVIPFKVSKKRPIVWCIVNNVDKDISGWAREISINLTDHMIFKLDMFGYDVYIGESEDELLREVAPFYEHAVVVASGTSFTLSDRLFPLVDDFCKQDFFIAGHVLDRGVEYPELHHQFYIVNLPEYYNAGMPTVGEGKEFNSLDANWHGWNIVPIAGARAIDFGQDIRNAKKYLYYEYDHVFLKELPNLYQNQFFGSNFFAAWNSDDPRESLNFDGPVDQYATVGSGLNWVHDLRLIGFTKDTTVIFTDINNNCLEYMRKLVNEWDGQDYVKFYRENMCLLPSGHPAISESYFLATQRSWEDFISTFDNWQETWNQMKQLKFKFVLINYTATYNFDWIETGKRTLVNVSDLFTHSPYVFVNSLKYRIGCENRLINLLKEKDPNATLLFTSRASDGFISNQQRIDKVKNFTLTDIEALPKPPWHISDWTSIRMLG